jgi:TonB family protein
MARTETGFRIPLRLWIILVSVCVHTIAGIVLLSMGPVVAARLPSGPLPVTHISVADDVPFIPEDETEDILPDVFENDPLPQPDPDDLAREDVPDEDRSEPIVVRLGTPVSGDGHVRMRSLRGRGPRRRPLRLRAESAGPSKTAARVVTRDTVRFDLADLPDGQGVALKIRVKLSASGAVTDVVVRRPSGVVSFDEAVLASVSQWQFKPATENGAAVTSSFDLTLTPARPKKMPAPTYPSRAIDRELTGVVRLAADVGTDGRVEKVHVLASSGIGMLDTAAIQAVEGWRFSPARVNGHATRCTVVVRPIRFRLID